MTNCKRFLRESLDNAVHTQLKRELTLIRTCFQTADAREGVRAMVERWEPRFEGR